MKRMITDTPWSKIGSAGAYHVWYRVKDGVGIYNVTARGATPGEGWGGYYNLESLLSLKGMTLNQVKWDEPNDGTTVPGSVRPGGV